MRLVSHSAIWTAILLLASKPSLAAEEGFTPLFDGKTLTGWTINCLPKDRELGAKAWTVDQGTILADTRGVIGFHIHSYHELRLRFKDIRIKELAPSGTGGVPGAGKDRAKAVAPEDESASRPRPIPSVKALADQVPCILDFFNVHGCPAFLIRPKDKTQSLPMSWVWYAPVIGHPNTSHAWMLRQWLEKGIGMAGVDVGESHGSPQGRNVYTALWETLTRRYGMSERPCLLPQSRGGLMLYNWAAENPARVACIAGIYTVCDLRSYPGVERACGAYGLRASELETRLAEHNPIDRLFPLAKAGVPILHVHGDADAVVPLEKNSGELARRYRAWGGKVRLIVIPGKGHQVCDEFFQCQELVDFVAAHGKDGIKLFVRDDLSGWIEEQHDFFKAKNPNVRTWSVKDGTVACDGSTGNCGFLRYEKKLSDFILRLEYRIAKSCNSGVCIRTRVPYDGHPDKTLPSQVGYEVQILDDADAPASKTSTGAFYGLVAPRANAAKPAGQWNTLEIVCRGPTIRVTLNGQVVQDVDQTKVDAIGDRPRSGYLSLQNHGGHAEFRNMRLKEEPPNP